MLNRFMVIFRSPAGVQLLSHVGLSVTPWTAARQASLSFTNSWSLRKLMFIESVMPSNHFILSHPLLLLPSIFPSIRVFSNESTQCINKKFLFFFAFPHLFVCIEFTLLKKTLSYIKYFSPYSTITSKD